MKANQKPPREPDYLREPMNAWRQGIGEFPVAYTFYHFGLALKRIEELKKEFGFEVVDMRLENDGWMDSFRKVVVTLITKRGDAVRMGWSDSNRDFMVKSPSGGWTSLHPDKVL